MLSLSDVAVTICCHCCCYLVVVVIEDEDDVAEHIYVHNSCGCARP